MWILEPLKSKYYSTKVIDTKTDAVVDIYIPFRNFTEDEVSEREKEDGWGLDDELYYDHVESQASYEAAKKIVKALNDETNCTGHRDEHGSRYDPFVRNSGH